MGKATIDTTLAAISRAWRRWDLDQQKMCNRLESDPMFCHYAPLMADSITTTTRSHWRDMLESTLYRNLKVEAGWNDHHNQFILKIPTKRPGYLVPPISWVVRPPRFRSLYLDPTGADLWEWCDGKTTVEQVIEKFARKHNLTFHESRVSATNYLKELIKRGALVVAI